MVVSSFSELWSPEKWNNHSKKTLTARTSANELTNEPRIRLKPRAHGGRLNPA